jgi:hypothetical protein
MNEAMDEGLKPFNIALFDTFLISLQLPTAVAAIPLQIQASVSH